MAKYLDNVQIQTAVRNMHDFDLSCMNLTTQFFMRPGIAYAKEFPAAKIKMNLKTFIRMQPLAKPILGSVQVHNRAFFVPFRLVYRPFNHILVQAPYNNSTGTIIPNHTPDLELSSLLQVLVNNSTTTTGSSYDFSYNGSNYVMSYKGRHYFKVLRQLGYPIINSKTKVSCLPLLCFAKIFLDWYFPAQYAHIGTYASVEGLFNRNGYFTLTQAEIELLLEACRCTFYGNDYFVANWESPVAPVSGTYDADPNFRLNDTTLLPTIGGNQVSNTSHVSYELNSGTPVVRGYSSGNQYDSPSPYNYTQYIDTALKAITNYTKRHQLVGARVLERYLADFQVRLSAEQLLRSTYINSQSFPIQFQDVMSNADTIAQSGGTTTGMQLGDYAGKGLAYDGQGSFEYDSDEYGMFIVINDITPDIAYYQGCSRDIFHTTCFDFYQPEFDKLGTQATRQVELVAPIGSAADTETIFGFLPRYAEYKVGRDSVTGLYEVESKNGGLMKWSTARVVPSGTVHSFNFCRGDDSWQYARIFYGSVSSPEDELDKFFVVHRCNIKAAMRMSPLYDTYDFDEPEGDTITVQANGSQLK